MIRHKLFTDGEKMDIVKILGVNISNINMEEAVDKLWDFCKEDKNHVVFTPNPEFVYRAYHDEEFCKKLNSADLTLPDGIGLIYASKIIGTPLKERVPGFEACSHIIEQSAEHDASIFILGGKPGVAELAKENIEKNFPGANVCGVCDGYFKDDESVIKKINECSPDFLLVCTGCPRQENWIYKYKDRLNVKVTIGAGGTVDVLSGTVKRAPKLFCKLGLEWFYRLITQPSRLGRMMSLPKFMLIVISKKLRGGGADA